MRDQSHNRYDSKTRRFYLDLFRDYSNFEILPKGVSAEEAINNTAFSISMLWTSTALLADSLGKPTFYYDASGSLNREDRGCHGVDLCIGKIKLEQKYKHYSISLIIDNHKVQYSVWLQVEFLNNIFRTISC